MTRAEVEAILVGTKGVTPGPLSVVAVGDGPKAFALSDADDVSLVTVVFEDDIPFSGFFEEADAQFFARLDPETVASLCQSLLTHMDRVKSAAQERDEARETNRKLNRLNQKYEHAFKYGLQTLEEKAIGGQRFPTDAKMFLQAWHMYRDARDRAEAAEARFASSRDEALEEAAKEVDLWGFTDVAAAIRALKGQP